MTDKNKKPFIYTMDEEGLPKRIPAVPEGKKNQEAVRSALDWLLEEFGGGSKNQLARRLSVARNTITWWFHNGRIGYVSARKISRDYDIPIEKLRPDVKLYMEKD